MVVWVSLCEAQLSLARDWRLSVWHLHSCRQRSCWPVFCFVPLNTIIWPGQSTDPWAKAEISALVSRENLYNWLVQWYSTEQRHLQNNPPPPPPLATPSSLRSAVSIVLPRCQQLCHWWHRLQEVTGPIIIHQVKMACKTGSGGSPSGLVPWEWLAKRAGAAGVA